jgi:acyl-CoA thioesterase I
MKTKFLLILISVFNFQTLFAQKVACIGNSITYGSGLSSRLTNCYPAQLDQMLSGNYDVRNYGVSGSVMLKAGDKPYWQQPEYNAALSFAPDIVIIMLGTNDSKSWNWTPANSLLFESDYKEFINSFRNLTSKPKIIISYPCKAYNGAFGISDSVIVNAICPIVKKISFDMGTTLVDMYTETSGVSNLFPDGIHPNIEGATKIANKFYSIITSAIPTITENGNVFIASTSNSYQWYNDYLPLSNQEGQTLKVNSDSTYSVAVSISNGANDDILHSKITQPGPRLSINGLSIYPNPVFSELNLKFQSSNNCLGSIEILNYLSKTIIEKEIELNTDLDYYSLNISNLAPAHYILKLKVGGEILISRFIKR